MGSLCGEFVSVTINYAAPTNTATIVDNCNNEKVNVITAADYVLELIKSEKVDTNYRRSRPVCIIKKIRLISINITISRPNQFIFNHLFKSLK